MTDKYQWICEDKEADCGMCYTREMKTSSEVPNSIKALACVIESKLKLKIVGPIMLMEMHEGKKCNNPESPHEEFPLDLRNTVKAL